MSMFVRELLDQRCKGSMIICRIFDLVVMLNILNCLFCSSVAEVAELLFRKDMTLLSPCCARCSKAVLWFSFAAFLAS